MRNLYVHLLSKHGLVKSEAVRRGFIVQGKKGGEGDGEGEAE